MIKDIITDQSGRGALSLLEASVDVDLETMTPKSSIVENLLDTARANKDRCIGLAANQIGLNKRVMVIRTEDNDFMVLMNLVIVAKCGGRKQGVEYCLSRVNKDGKMVGSKVKRYKEVIVKYYAFNKDGAPVEVRAKYEGLAAKTIQHEVDHFDGKLI